MSPQDCDARRAIATSEMPVEHLAMLEAALADKEHDRSKDQDRDR